MTTTTMKFLQTLYKWFRKKIGRPIPEPLEIVLFGGSFNPPHLAHMEAIRVLTRYLPEKSQIWILPSRNPQKFLGSPMDYISDTDCLAMVKLAVTNYISRNSAFGYGIKIWDYYPVVGSHYMIDSVKYLCSHYADENEVISLLIGMDQLINFRNWRDWELILKMCHCIYVVQREGEDMKEVPNSLLKSKKIRILPDKISMESISSTQIRRAIQTGLPDNLSQIRPFIDTDILNYIYLHKLYRMPFYDLSERKE